MKSLSIHQIIEATGGKLLQKGNEEEIQSIHTDSRKQEKHSLFIPLVGERFDAHDFISQAVENGAAAVLSSKEISLDNANVTIILVNDTLQALQDLARYYRNQFEIKVVAVTGSVGKTSTKDMIFSVLNEQYCTLKTEGNFNNEIGLPLTIFRIEPEHEVIILEMGMNHFGEIHRLSSIAQPDVAVITNIGLSHVENLGSQQGILKAKCEIFDYLKPNGTVILNGDDSLLKSLKGKLPFKQLFYSIKGEGDFVADQVQSNGEKGITFDYIIDGERYPIFVPKPGVHMVLNALAAVAVGNILNVPLNKMIDGISKFQATKMRMDILTLKNDVKMINDAYNASPDSMKSALQVLTDMALSNRTIAVLGDMLEMGSFAKEAHLTVGRYTAEHHIDILITKGMDSKYIAQGAIENGMDSKSVFSFDTNEEAGEKLLALLEPHDYVLIKGSRGMRMEEIVETVKEGARNE